MIRGGSHGGQGFKGNSNNLIGGERKFVLWAITRGANGQRTMPFRRPTILLESYFLDKKLD